MFITPESGAFAQKKVSEEVFIEMEHKVFTQLFNGDDKALTRWIIDGDNAIRARELIEKHLLKNGESADIDMIVSELRDEVDDMSVLH